MKLIENGKTVEGYPIYILEDENGYCEFAVCDDAITVYLIMTSKEGTMKKMLDYIVEKFGINEIWFWVPSKELLRKLKNITNVYSDEMTFIVKVRWMKNETI